MNKELKILAIDDDADILRLYEFNLKERGYHVTAFENSQIALKAVDEIEFDAILLDWNMPMVSGMAVLNRIRHSLKNRFSPVIVISGYLGKQDMSLVNEFPLTDAHAKPITIDALQSYIDHGMKSSAWFKSNWELIKKHFLDDSKDPLAVYQEVKELIKSSSESHALMVAAAVYLKKRDARKEAKVILASILKENPNCLSAYSELGKILIDDGEYKKAIRLLNAAQAKSPDNLDRLSDIGDATMLQYDFQAAINFYKQCAQKDPGNPKYNAKLTIATNLQQFDGINFSDVLANSYIGLLNGLGVALIREGKFNEGMIHYNNLLTLIDEPIKKAKLAYNIGLGYLKWKRPKDSLHWFKDSAEFLDLASEGEDFNKPLEYIEKMLANPRAYGLSPEEIKTILQTDSSQAVNYQSDAQRDKENTQTARQQIANIKNGS